MAKKTDDGRFSKHDKVIATRDLRGVPEGTRGSISVVNGITWARYWVQFDNGVWLSTIPGDALVAARGWEDYKRRRAEEAARPAAQAVAEAAPTEAAAPAAGGEAASNVPAHLLERAKKARERKAAAAG
jgi:hypothetical protein